MWDEAQQELLWVDILTGVVHRTRADGLHDRAIDVGEHVGAVVPASDGRLVVAARSGFRLIDPGMDHPLLAALPVVPGAPELRMNDGKCDPHGRFVAGTMGYQSESGAGALWSFDGRRLTCLLEGVTVSNGLAWSEDAATMYYVDTSTQRVDAFDYDVEAARLSRRRTEVEIPSTLGAPDGLTIDREGGLWVALWGGAAVHRYADGRLQEVVEVPARCVASCTFGGRGYATLHHDRRGPDLTTKRSNICGP